MPSPLSSALAKLDDSIRVLEERLHSLDASLEVPREEFIQSLTEARQNADTVRELIRAERPDVEWEDRLSLEKLIGDVAAAAEADRKELRRRQLLDLAEELNAGAITHRLKSRVTALEALREDAVRELQAEANEEQPKELPGPEASAWMQWACGWQENAGTDRFSELEGDFPALLRFAGEMEETYWQPRQSGREIPAEIAAGYDASRPESPMRQARPQLSDAAPAFAARYGHLSAARASQSESTADTATVASAVAQAPSSVSQLSEQNAAVAVEQSPQSVAEDSARVISSKPVPELFTFAGAMPGEGESKGSRFGLNRTVLITLAATVVIGLVVLVISGTSGHFTGKRGSAKPVTTAGDPATSNSSAASDAPVSDLELVGQIEQRLKGIQGSSIYVTVQHGTAILEGQVPSEDAMANAEQLTLQSSQIKVVRDRLQVRNATGTHSTATQAKPNAAGAE